MHLVSSPRLAFAALVIEALAGYPSPLYRATGHPVTWIGAWLAWLERHLNRSGLTFFRRRTLGVLALGLLLLPVAIATTLLTLAAPPGWIGFLLLGVLAASMPAQRSLDDHVRAVAETLERAGLEGGRRAVAMIVGRNPQALDEAGVARAAIESLAENFSDGVVAPLFWLVIGGLPGGALYKAVNTADSMIGHKNDRYLAFGWAAARLDDLVNLPASRLAALWLVLAAALLPGASAPAALRALRRDAGRHRSPNAGWPEAAMAGALGLKLAGPRVYGEDMIADVFMGDGRSEANAADIRSSLRLYRLACLLQAVAIGALALIWRG
jgi:adenosylcobinamide-phosphate synthase